MQLTSIKYFCFVTVVFLLYWKLPHKQRIFWLLLADYVFYISIKPVYAVLLALITWISYTGGHLIDQAEGEEKKKSMLTIFIILCILPLFIFKYLGFFAGIFNSLFALIHAENGSLTVHLIAPVGISFYTFEAISYLADIKQGKIQAENDLLIYAAYLSFFPQLLAGPISRASDLIPQFRAERDFDYIKAAYGLKQIAWGYFKKIAIADTLAIYTSPVFNEPKLFPGSSLLLASLFYTIQIYADFSGYSDIAIGTAKLFGISLMDNFRSPYFSQSIKEFWNRWHISLSTWFRDYIYIPCGGNRVGKPRHIFNLMLTFLVSGLWHGAAWNFVFWGGIAWLRPSG